MPNPAWFNEEYFAGQKIAQMTALGQTIPDGATAVEQVNAAIAQWNASHADQSVANLFDNFEACNTEGYITSVVNRNQINVSPNELFDVTYYLTALAKNANDTGYAGAPEGGWTAQSVLQNMYQGGYSAWTHFMGDGLDRMIDCSSSFNTKAYLDDKAAATEQTVDQVIAQMKADGLNPVMDYYLNGQALGITAKPVTTPLDVTMSDAAVWVDGGGDVPPAPETDPYDEIASHVEIKAGDNGPYEGEDGVNTQFEAVWTKVAGESTLAATDEIHGGTGEDTYNTLQVELGDNWNGFHSKTAGAMGQTEDMVTGVGRIKLDRQEMGSEQTFTFSAKGISDDTVRFDLNAAGTGATNLRDLSGAVKEVNISGLKTMDIGNNAGKTNATTLTFEKDAHNGSNDTLTIGLNDVAAPLPSDAYDPAVVNWNTKIETVVLNATGGANNVDIQSAKGLKNVEMDVAKDATLGVWSKADGVKAYDAAGSEGAVNMYISGLKSQTVTGGSSANDSVHITDADSVVAKNWTAVENVAFEANANINFNAEGAQGINAFWINNAGTYNVSNLKADSATVYQTKDVTTSTTTINGKVSRGDSSLDNVTWQSQVKQTSANKAAGKAQDVQAHFDSNADGTATINVGENNYLATGSKFQFVNAAKLDINSVTATDKDALTTNTGQFAGSVMLYAPKATELTVDYTGPANFLGQAGGTDDSTSLAKVQTLSLTLQNNNVQTGFVDVFNMENLDLLQAQKVNVDAGGCVVKLGDLGTTGSGTNATPGLTLEVSGADSFAVGKMEAGLGYNIQGNIEVTNGVTLGDITTSTNASSNVQGDVYLNVAAGGDVTLAGTATANCTIVKGGDITLDFSDVQGGVGTTIDTASVHLVASESINYLGAVGKDFVNLDKMGKDQVANIELGGGADELKIADLGVAATINVDLGSDSVKDVLTVTAPATANLTINVQNFSSSKDTATAGTADKIDGFATSKTDLQAVLAAFNISEGSGDFITVGSNADSGFVVGNDVYLGVKGAAGFALIDLVGAASLVYDNSGTATLGMSS